MVQCSLAVKAFTWMISFFTSLSPNNKSCYLLNISDCLVLHFVGNILLFCLVLTTILHEDGIFPILVETWDSDGAHSPQVHQSWASNQVCLTEAHVPHDYIKHCLVIYTQAAKLPCNFTQCLLPHQQKGKTKMLICQMINSLSSQVCQWSFSA